MTGDDDISANRNVAECRTERVSRVGVFYPGYFPIWRLNGGSMKVSICEKNACGSMSHIYCARHIYTEIPDRVPELAVTVLLPLAITL